VNANLLAVTDRAAETSRASAVHMRDAGAYALAKEAVCAARSTMKTRNRIMLRNGAKVAYRCMV